MANSFHSARILFLGEQDGPVERQLKSKLIEIFHRFPAVKAASLLRISTIEVPGINVAVAITGGDKEAHALVPLIGDAFASLFHASEHLDILFPNPAQTAEIAKIAGNFYTVDTPLKLETKKQP
jgi:hypothetical protein